jgi:hypothetical protein
VRAVASDGRIRLDLGAQSTEAGFAVRGAGLSGAHPIAHPIQWVNARPLRTDSAFAKIEQHRGTHDGAKHDGEDVRRQVESGVLGRT